MALHQHVFTSPFTHNFTDALLQPLKHCFSMAFLLGSLAVQSIVGRPSVSRERLDLDTFINIQTPISYSGLLCNIGPDGCHAQGVGPGVVIASPDREDPDYFYTWTRDSGLVFKCLVDILEDSFDPALQTHIQNYITTQAALQGVSNPSGGLRNGEGLGEPKFHVDLSAFTENWGRPQRDGPALRAIAIIGYGKWLARNGYTDTVFNVLWPIILNDLHYVAQYWNATGFDLWEEVEGSSFFTAASQHRALVEGLSLAQSLDQSCEVCSQVAPQILCFMQTFWSPEGSMLANINSHSGRSERDANVILASIHTFDPAVGCDAATFQPCSDLALASHKVIVDSFRSIYGVNDGVPPSFAVAIGRYPEDAYYGGQPWYLCTLAAAELLYDATFVWRRQGFITITDTSLKFFKDHLTSASPGTFNQDTPEYRALMDAVSAYADGFLSVVGTYTPHDGSLAEQFHRNSGEPMSAKHLTWSYAAFLTATRRRASVLPPPWVGTSLPSPPETCLATSATGTYTTPTSTSFPGNETPRPGTPPPGKQPIHPPKPPLCQVTFEARVETHLGQTVKLVGDVLNLGSWQPEKGVTLDPSHYTSKNPIWRAIIVLSPGKGIQYKYVVVESDGSITWEADPNHRYTVPSDCGTGSVRHDEWQK